MTKPRLIKKYKNRRLYDLETSKYITVLDLQYYVLDGVVFQVVDAASGKDITNATLLQIFVEMEGNSTQLLSAEILRQLIIMARHPMNNVFKSMLEQMMINIENQLPKSIDLDDYQKEIRTWNEQTKQFLSQWMGVFFRR